MQATKTLLLLAMCCWSLASPAQQIFQQALNVTGSSISISNPNRLIEYSIGEVATTTTGTPGAGDYYTAGIIQPTYLIVNVNEAFDERYALSVFPNPVAHQLAIETDFTGFTDYRFNNLQGQKIIAGRFDYSPLDLSWMPGGIYLLTLFSTKEQITKTIKIIKQ